jgi:hypothetical protein
MVGLVAAGVEVDLVRRDEQDELAVIAFAQTRPVDRATVQR